MTVDAVTEANEPRHGDDMSGMGPFGRGRDVPKVVRYRRSPYPRSVPSPAMIRRRIVAIRRGNSAHAEARADNHILQFG
jgi:hypothetical protein